MEGQDGTTVKLHISLNITKLDRWYCMPHNFMQYKAHRTS